MSARSKTGVRVSEDVDSKRMAELRQTTLKRRSAPMTPLLNCITNIHHATDFHGLVTLATFDHGDRTPQGHYRSVGSIDPGLANGSRAGSRRG